jgi:hypothetical protein
MAMIGGLDGAHNWPMIDVSSRLLNSSRNSCGEAASLARFGLPEWRDPPFRPTDNRHTLDLNAALWGTNGRRSWLRWTALLYAAPAMRVGLGVPASIIL